MDFNTDIEVAIDEDTDFDFDANVDVCKRKRWKGIEEKVKHILEKMFACNMNSS